MRNIIIFTICIFLSGCMSLDYDSLGYDSTEVITVTQPESIVEEVKEKGRLLINIEKVYIGMLKEELEGVMGAEIIIGYQKNKETGDLGPIKIKNPYRVETLQAKEKIYDVMYYFTSINKTDGVISEDELTPFVFEEDILVGRDWSFLFRLKNEF